MSSQPTQVFLNPSQALHALPHETVQTLGQEPDHCLEHPGRIRALLESLQALPPRLDGTPRFDFIDHEKDHGIDALLEVHSGEYLDYLRDAYADWIADGLAGVSRALS